MSGKRIISLFICLALLGGCGFGGGLSDSFKFSDTTEEDVQTVTFGRVPSETVISLLRDNEPLIHYLEKNLDVDIQFVFAENYDDIIRGMKNDEFDFALLGPYAYVLARDKTDYKAIVRRERYGKDWYKGIIFTHRKHGIDSLAELENESFAFVDPSSASGYLFPKARLIEAGLADAPDKLAQSFSSMTFLGRHDRVVRAVHRGEYTAGATYKDARTSSGLPEDANPKETLPILAETRKIPTSPIVVNNQFRSNNKQLTKQIIKYLITLHESEEGKRVLESLGIDRYIRSKEGDYSEVEKVRDTLSGADS